METRILFSKAVSCCRCAVLLAPFMAMAGQDPMTGDYGNLSGEELVRRLTNPATRSPAFYELSRRTDKECLETYEKFLEGHYEPEVVVCPQIGGKDPLYLVLFGFLSRDMEVSEEGYRLDKSEELFSPLRPTEPPRAWKEPAMIVFTSKGQCVDPFGGNNVLQKRGVVRDINGDGFVECLNTILCSIEGVKGNVDVLIVQTVAEKPSFPLMVLYNWDRDEWSFQLTHSDREGVLDIEAGTKIAGGIKPKVRYRWDAVNKTYVGPDGKTGDHFRRLTNKDFFEEFEALQKAGLVFPPDPDFVDERQAKIDSGVWSRLGKKKPNPRDVSKPYRYVSLKNLTDADILRFMGDGKNMRELEADVTLKTHAPSNFWSMPPKAAALAYAEENRYPDHRARYRLAVDGRDGQKPPEVCSLAFTDASDESYNDVDSHYFLRVDPKRSYLAYARSWEGGMVFYNAIHNAPAFDFRFNELTYAEARQIADTIWWLNRVRSKSADDATDEIFGGGWSSADGCGALTIGCEDGAVVLRLCEKIWPFHVAERWSTGYSPEVCLNLAAYLIEGVLTQRLGDRWSKFAPKHAQDILSRETSAPKYENDEVRHILAWAENFLGLFSPDQKEISFAIVQESARAAGGFADTNQLVRLENVLKQLQALPKPARTRESVEAEIKRLEAVKVGDPHYEEVSDKIYKLYDELRSVRTEVDTESLKRYVELALRKIRLVDDIQALLLWACTREDGCQWALQQLQKKDRLRYVAALEWWLKNTKEKWARQAYDAITASDEVRASQIAGGVEPGKKGDLSVSAFARLKEAGAIPDEKKRVETLIQIALAPKSGWEQRREALRLLVPRDQPMRYPDRAIDKTLVELFDPQLADETCNFTLYEACHALARRGRVEHFDEIAKLMSSPDPMNYGYLLNALMLLAKYDAETLNKRLSDLLRPELKQTNKNLIDIFWAIWALNLKALRADIQSLATSSPDDYEDERASCYGGEVSRVEGRFHLARQILALWNEEDLVTRCRLLIAFGYKNKYDFVGEPKEERLARLKDELAGLAHKLSPEQKQRVADFVAWCGESQKEEELVGEGADHVKAFTTLVKVGLALP